MAVYKEKDKKAYLEYYRKLMKRKQRPQTIQTFAQWKGGKSFGTMPWESRRQYLNLSSSDAAEIQKLLKKGK